jgi:hypothetical protein
VADPNRALFESVVRLLAPVLDELVFVGGCTTGLFITDPAAGGIRPTKDVDAIVDVTSYAKYAALSARLRALGLAEDTTTGAPLCRWRRDDLIVDVLPVNERVLGFSNRWYPAAHRGRPDDRHRRSPRTSRHADVLHRDEVGRVPWTRRRGHRRESRSRGHHRRAIDRPLTDRQVRELRAISTRAAISRTSFSIHDEYGDLKANARDLLVKYFDASLYFAHWMYLEVAF